MQKYCLSLNDTVSVGPNSPTLLNVLLGANHVTEHVREWNKIIKITENHLPVSIITDLSLASCKKGDELWRKICNDTQFIAGTVPIYQSVSSAGDISSNALLDLIQEQAEVGVKLMTIHPTPTRRLLQLCKQRYIPITSRGGGVVCRDMLKNFKKENVYMQVLDQVIEIANKHCVTLSIGSSFRSASIHDALDDAYISELSSQIEIAEYCKKRGVLTILETPGHASPQAIFQICNYLNDNCGFPIMPLGPLPIDSALQYDDYAASVGAILMGTRNCADILSVVTREEHTGGLPSEEALIEAINKYVVAKHIIDVYKVNDTNIDDELSLQRSKYKTCTENHSPGCDRCGPLCPLILHEV